MKSLENWKIDSTEDYLRLKYMTSPYLVPKYALIFGKDLSFVIVIFGYLVVVFQLPMIYIDRMETL